MKVPSPSDSSMTAVTADLSIVELSDVTAGITSSASDSDAEKIGTFAGINGAVEVGLGSILNAYHIPLKGHFLAYLQNVMLIAFGKTLNGRGLIRISFISAMLKAFSPFGARFAPMMYIFSQGAVFAAPVAFFGWNALVVMLSSILMSWFTLALSLVVKYLLFGESIFVAYENVIFFLKTHTGYAVPSLLQVILGAFVLKAIIAILLSTAAYYGNIQPLVQGISKKKKRGARLSRLRESPHGFLTPKKERQPKQICRLALGDILNFRFIAMILLTSLLLFFFAGLSSTALFATIVRGICISYLGFLIIRRVDIQKVAGYLDRRFGLGLGQSLPIALKAISKKNSATDSKPDQK